MNYGVTPGRYDRPDNVYSDGAPSQIDGNGPWSLDNITHRVVNEKEVARLATPLDPSVGSKLNLSAISTLRKDKPNLAKLFSRDELQRKMRLLEHEDIAEMKYGDFKSINKGAVDELEAAYLTRLQNTNPGMAKNRRSGMFLYFSAFAPGALLSGGSNLVSIFLFAPTLSYAMAYGGLLMAATGGVLSAKRGLENLVEHAVNVKCEQLYYRNKNPGKLARLGHYMRHVRVCDSNDTSYPLFGDEKQTLQRIRPYKLDQELASLRQELESEEGKTFVSQENEMKAVLRDEFIKQATAGVENDFGIETKRLATIFAERVIDAQRLDDIANGQIRWRSPQQNPEIANDNYNQRLYYTRERNHNMPADLVM